MHHPSFSLTPDTRQAGSARGDWRGAASYCCACCGLTAPGTGTVWAATAHPGQAGQTVCPPCDLLQNTARAGIDSEACLIWQPALTQERILFLANMAYRHLWRACPSDDRAAHWAMALDTRDDPDGIARLPLPYQRPLRLLRLLMSGKREIAFRLESTSVQHVGMALLLCPPVTAEITALREDLFGGLRLLPSGHLFEQGTDIFPLYLERTQSL